MICSCCKEFFEKGTGHLCFCSECSAKGLPDRHPMCDQCYQQAKKDNIIKDVNYNQTELSPDLKDKII